MARPTQRLIKVIDAEQRDDCVADALNAERGAGGPAEAAHRRAENSDQDHRRRAVRERDLRRHHDPGPRPRLPSQEIGKDDRLAMTRRQRVHRARLLLRGYLAALAEGKS